METSVTNERRARNLIWNAAGDYSFTPDFVSYDRDGEPDLYFNCIIGAVSRYYDYIPLQQLTNRMHKLREAYVYLELLWVGLEGCTYEKAVVDRPILAELRRSHAEKIVNESKAYWDMDRYERIKVAHYAAVIGREARLREKEKKILSALQFDTSMDSAAIAARMEEIMRIYFHCHLPKEQDGPRRPLIPIRLKQAALHGSPLVHATSLVKEQENDVPKVLTILLPVLYASTGSKMRLSFLENNYGISIYPDRELQNLEKSLCTDAHKNCHLHVTRGEFRMSGASLSPIRSAMQMQKTLNLSYHHAHLSQHMLAIAKLADRIRNVLQCDSGGEPIRNLYGTLDATRIWRAPSLHDHKVFLRNDPSTRGNLSIDILMDASASQQNRQERIASQGYIIAEALTRCGLPTRVCSYCTVSGTTILHQFRDYEEPQYNERIFEYLATGWNRDGMAVRITGERLLSSAYDNKLLVILSDCSPNDDRKLFVPKPVPFYYDYGGRRGITDTAKEVSVLRRYGISILAVCTGMERDLPAAREIFGNDVVWAQEPERFADAVGYLIQQKIRYL